MHTHTHTVEHTGSSCSWIQPRFCVDRLGIDVKGVSSAFIEDSARDHRQRDVCLAAGIDDVLCNVVQRLHVRHVQIEHDKIRLLARLEAIAVIEPHHLCADRARRMQDLDRVRRRRADGQLLQTRNEEHFAEEIETVVARRSVGPDRNRYARFVIRFDRRNAARKLHVGARIGADIEPALLHDLDIARHREYHVEPAAAAAEHAQRIKIRDRGHPRASDAVLDFGRGLRQMRKDRLLKFL